MTLRQQGKGEPEIRKTYCELLYPGSFYPEKSVIEVKSRDPQSIADKYPQAFAFLFYDLIAKTVTVGGQKKRVTTDRLNESARFYPKATVMTVQDVKHLAGDYRILIANMEGNNWPRVVRTNRGNFQPLQTGDTVL